MVTRADFALLRSNKLLLRMEMYIHKLLAIDSEIC